MTTPAITIPVQVRLGGAIQNLNQVNKKFDEMGLASRALGRDFLRGAVVGGILGGSMSQLAHSMFASTDAGRALTSSVQHLIERMLTPVTPPLIGALNYLESDSRVARIIRLAIQIAAFSALLGGVASITNFANRSIANLVNRAATLLRVLSLVNPMTRALAVHMLNGSGSVSVMARSFGFLTRLTYPFTLTILWTSEILRALAALIRSDVRVALTIMRSLLQSVVARGFAAQFAIRSLVIAIRALQTPANAAVLALKAIRLEVIRIGRFAVEAAQGITRITSVLLKVTGIAHVAVSVFRTVGGWIDATGRIAAIAAGFIGRLTILGDVASAWVSSIPVIGRVFNTLLRILRFTGGAVLFLAEIIVFQLATIFGFDKLADAIAKPWIQLWDWLPNILTDNLESMHRILQTGVDGFNAQMWGAFASMLRTAWEGLQGLVSVFASWLPKLAGDWDNLWRGITNSTIGEMNRIIGIAVDFVNNLSGILNNVPGVNIPNIRLSIQRVGDTLPEATRLSAPQGPIDVSVYMTAPGVYDIDGLVDKLKQVFRRDHDIAEYIQLLAAQGGNSSPA